MSAGPDRPPGSTRARDADAGRRSGGWRLGPWDLGPWDLGPWHMRPRRVGPWRLGPWHVGRGQRGPWRAGRRQLGARHLGTWRLGPWYLESRLARALRLAIERHGDLLTNAASLLGTTVVTSLLGFVFWWVAARLFPTAAVGYGSAAVSALSLLGTVAMLGLNTTLIGELAKNPYGSGPLVAASLLTSAGAGAVLGGAFVLVAGGGFAPYVSSPRMAVLFTAGVALTSATLVLDQALIGLLHGGLQLWRNGVFAAAKLVLLCLAAVALRDRFGVGILTSWIMGTAVSVVVLAALLQRKGIRVLHPPQFEPLRRLSRAAAGHNWLNLALQTPRFALPILATALVSATAGAGFYAAWTVVGLGYLVPGHLTTVLYAVGAANMDTLRRKIRFTLKLSLVGGVAGVFLLVIGADPAMDLFGEDYERAITPLRILALGYFPTVLKVHYVAVCRIYGHVAGAAVVAAAGCALELGSAIVGAVTGGLVGLSLGLFLAMCVEGVIMAPPVWHAARGL